MAWGRGRALLTFMAKDQTGHEEVRQVYACHGRQAPAEPLKLWGARRFQGIGACHPSRSGLNERGRVAWTVSRVARVK
jgi:hypothetical protein